LKVKKVSARVTEDLYEEIVQHSRKVGIDISEAIRRALIAWRLGDFDPTKVDPDALKRLRDNTK